MLLNILIFIIACSSGFLQSISGFGYSVVSMATLPMLMTPVAATTVSGVVGNLQSIVLSGNRKLERNLRYFKAVKMNCSYVIIQVKFVHFLQKAGYVIHCLKFSRAKPIPQKDKGILRMHQCLIVTACQCHDFV